MSLLMRMSYIIAGNLLLVISVELVFACYEVELLKNGTVYIRYWLLGQHLLAARIIDTV